jgi:hypothetical protein
VIDDEDGVRSFGLFQFEPQLSVDGVEDREGAIGVGVVGGISRGGKDLIGGAEAEREIVCALQACAVNNRVVDITAGYVLEFIADLGDGHVLATEEAVEDGVGYAGIFAIRARSLLALGALGGIGGALKFGVCSHKRISGDGAVLHMPLHLKALRDHGSHHAAQVFVVDRVAGRKLVNPNIGSSLGGNVEFFSIEPFRRVDDRFLIAGVEAPTEVNKEAEGSGASFDLIAGDATVAFLVRGAGLDDGDLEGCRRRLGKQVANVGYVGGRGFVNARNLEDRARGGFEFQLES